MIPCSHCGKSFVSQDDPAARTVHCPDCSQATLIPGSKVVAGSARLDLVAPQSDYAADRFLDALDSDPRVVAASVRATCELGWLGPYRLLKMVGKGGMGVVYRAEDPLLKRPVALKTPLPELAADADVKERFLREAQAAAAIKHRHIVTIHHVGDAGGTPYLAMEFLEGESLEQRLRRAEKATSEAPTFAGGSPSTVTVAEIVDISREIAEGLAAAHERGLIHRDIKPANIWLETLPSAGTESAPRSCVKILDFGLARALSGSSQLTRSGEVIGTPAYMAPEQASGKAVDHRTDLFSLGCVLYRMCTGKFPFPGLDNLAILSALANVTPCSPMELNSEIPPALAELVMDLLAKEPLHRPQSALMVCRRLEAIAAGSAETRRSAKPPRTRWRVAGALALCLAVVLLVMAMNQHRTPSLALEGNKGNGTAPLPAGSPLTGDEYVFAMILQHLRTVPDPNDRRFLRFFSSHHLSGADGAGQRQALAMALNHLSRASELVQPRSIDEAGTVFVIDLRALGWEQQPLVRATDQKPADLNTFDLVLLEYPFGVIPTKSASFAELVREFLLPAGQVLPITFVRSDWFVTVATQAPLYYELLQLPGTVQELEQSLGVDVKVDFAKKLVQRAGLTGSIHDRVVERHPTRNGAYWKTFDSANNWERILKDPIDLSLTGGEVLFNLPNNFQGYFAYNAQGDRVDFASADAVTGRTAHDATLRAGLTCMRCHVNGVKDFIDEVRDGVANRPGKERILTFYPEQPVMDRVVKTDRQRFVGALEKLVGPESGDADPLTVVSDRFLKQPGGTMRQGIWEPAVDRPGRDIGPGVPVLALDGLTRRDFAAGALDVDLTTNKGDKIFKKGNVLKIIVTNNSKQAVFIELFGTSVDGMKVPLATNERIEPARKYYYPLEIQNQDQQGREQITLYASDRELPAAALLHGNGRVADRVVHRFYRWAPSEPRIEIDVDPGRVLKKTIDIETK